MPKVNMIDGGINTVVLITDSGDNEVSNNFSSSDRY